MEGEAAWRASPAMRCETRGSGYSPSLMQGGSARNRSGSSPFRVIHLPHGSACVARRCGDSSVDAFWRKCDRDVGP